MRRYALIALALLLALPLTACARHWVKDGATRQEYRQDHYACNRDTLMLPHADWGIQTLMFRRCMESKGWELTTAQ